MDRFEVELDKLAEVAWHDLPHAADYLDAAALHIAHCDGLNNRRIFGAVDEAFAHVRDNVLPTSLHRIQDSLTQTARALQVVHARYGGADQSASLEILRAGQKERDLAEYEISEDRDRQQEQRRQEADDILSAEEVSEHVYGEFVPWTRGD